MKNYNNRKGSKSLFKEKCEDNLVRTFVEYFWFHDEPAIQQAFRENTRFREMEEDKYPIGIFQESAQWMEKEKAFIGLLSGLDQQAYHLLCQAREQT